MISSSYTGSESTSVFLLLVLPFFNYIIYILLKNIGNIHQYNLNWISHNFKDCFLYFKVGLKKLKLEFNKNNELSKNNEASEILVWIKWVPTKLSI